jgi:mRNA interferase HigB
MFSACDMSIRERQDYCTAVDHSRIIRYIAIHDRVLSFLTIRALEPVSMRIIAKRTLREFWEQPGHQEAEQPLKTWYSEVRKAAWRPPTDVKAHYGSASILPNGRVVFNIGGNKYWLIVMIRYDTQMVFIRFVGTHAAYDRIQAETI